MGTGKPSARTMMDSPALADPVRRLGAVAFAMSRAPEAHVAAVRFDAGATNRVRPGHGRTVGELAIDASLRWAGIAERQASRLDGEPSRMRIAEAVAAMTRSIQPELMRMSRDQASLVAASLLRSACEGTSGVGEGTLAALDGLVEGIRGRSPGAAALSRILDEQGPSHRRERAAVEDVSGPTPR